MVFNLKQTQSNIPPSSTSSCTEYISEINCGNSRCPKCCISSAINDHTYEVLKKICKKIIKDLNRKQCRENYSIFDGGNSVKVRIQRGQNMDAERLPTMSKLRMTDSNYVGAKGRQIDEFGEKGRTRQKSSGRLGKNGENDESAAGKTRDRARSKSTKRGGEDGDDEAYGDKAKGGKAGPTKNKKSVDGDEDDYDPRSKKTKDRKSSKQSDDFENDNKASKSKAKGKNKPDDDVEETERSKKGKSKGKNLDDDSDTDLKKAKSKKSKGDDDYDETDRNKKGKGKGKPKGRTLDDIDDDSETDLKKKKSKQDKSKAKRRSGDADDDDDIGTQKRNSKGKKKGKGRNEDDDDIPTGKRKSKQKPSSDMPIITDLRSKVRKGQEVRPEAKQGRAGAKEPKKDKDRLMSLDNELSKLKKKQKSAKQLLAEQQENTKGRGKSARGGSRLKSQRSSSRQYGSRSAHGFVSEARIPSKLSRGDQARPCDFLRANMEQRELCRQCDQICVSNRAPCSDPCNNRGRARNVCSEVIQSCYYPPNTCF